MYQENYRESDLSEYIAIAQEALISAPDDHKRLSALSYRHRQRLHSKVGLDELHEAIQVGQKAFDKTADKHPDRYGYV